MKTETRQVSKEGLKDRLKKVEVSESYFAAVKGSLMEDVFGQEEACETVARMITKCESGINDPNRPVGVAMFLGPTGVGKTEMSRALSRHLFGNTDKHHFKIIDCSDYSESHTISRFIGSPPGYVGYGDDLVLDSKFLDNRNVLVFDEIEKADPALWKLLLSVFETGILHARGTVHGSRDPEEIELKFNQSFIILTSNVGAKQIQDQQRNWLGFVKTTQVKDIKDTALNGMMEYFAEMPEFLGRINEFVVFNPLQPEHYEQIYWKLVSEMNAQLSTRLGVEFFTTQEVASFILNKAVADTRFGAREIRKTIETQLIQSLSDVLIAHPEIRGLIADIENEDLIFYDLTPEMPPVDITPHATEEDLLQRAFTPQEYSYDLDEEEARACEYRLITFFRESPKKFALIDKILGDIKIKEGKVSRNEKQEPKVLRALSLVAFLSKLKLNLNILDMNEETERKLVTVLRFYRRVAEEV